MMLNYPRASKSTWCALATLALYLVAGCTTNNRHFYTWQSDAGEALNEVAETEGSFSAIVERRFGDPGEGKLLALAEATYPLFEDSIILVGFQRPRQGENPKWWISSFDGIKVPVALTRGSVDYYLALIRAFRAGDFSGANGIPQQSARLHYSGEIESAWLALESDAGVAAEDLYIARMELEWESNCGTRCGLSFKRTRTAVIHRDGTVLEVLEDPLPPVSIR